jgi:hypothetical protein
VKSDLKGLSGVHPSALAHSSCRHGVVAVTSDLLAEKEDGTSRNGCAEEGVSTSMTASCDVPKPSRNSKEVCNADVEVRENRRIKLKIHSTTLSPPVLHCTRTTGTFKGAADH